MILDSRDKTILQLAGRCRWRPYDALGRFGFAGLTDEIGLLEKLGVLTISRDRKYIYPSRQGYEILQANGFTYCPGSKRAYAGSPVLRRRLRRPRS